jgi:UDP-GlcNAc:undecaprenyl-phosphate/decaprenyl-phosphate GlcNAc-1-phosphate transferase
MHWLVLALIPIAFVVALGATWIVRRISNRLAAFDSPGVPGQTKAARRRIPNTGGIGIVAGFVLPISAILLLISNPDLPFQILGQRPWLEPLRAHLPGLASQRPAAAIMIAGALLLHALGLIDDRKPLGPFLKLIVMALPAAVIVTLTDTRLLTLLDPLVGGPWLSITLTVLWILVVTNAMNFMDNMDGLSAGVGVIAGLCFLATALVGGQWFVAGSIALLIGSLLGFLVFNRPPATIFMGDGGSIVIGFLLAFLSVRITYHQSTTGWYAVLTPLIVLAVPLYDFLSVVVLRLRQGKSPFVGDLQHLSHRLVRRGLSKPLAVIVIYGFTAVTGMSAIFLRSITPEHATLIGVQILLLLIVLAVLEFGGDTKPTP